MVWRQAESASAWLRACRAVTPADWAFAFSVMLARRIAQASVVLLLRCAGQRSASGAAIRVLGARDADVSHAAWAIWGAHAAADVVEVFTALGVPEKAPLLAVIALLGGTCTTAVAVRLVTEGAVVAELTRAVLPADRADTVVTIAAPWVAKCTILFFVSGAS